MINVKQQMMKIFLNDGVAGWEGGLRIWWTEACFEINPSETRWYLWKNRKKTYTNMDSRVYYTNSQELVFTEHCPFGSLRDSSLHLFPNSRNLRHQEDSSRFGLNIEECNGMEGTICLNTFSQNVQTSTKVQVGRVHFGARWSCSFLGYLYIMGDIKKSLIIITHTLCSITHT